MILLRLIPRQRMDVRGVYATWCEEMEEGYGSDEQLGHHTNG
jgi:hypothetical protein